ncbi:MAG TPA: PQQ-dependent sugar dehydrogenase, partial [Thermomicrobiales bacterium]|nr:PQQ-dependent sugar dehydrogenase [Thermomicrobiales bacterium]
TDDQQPTTPDQPGATEPETGDPQSTEPGGEPTPTSPTDPAPEPSPTPPEQAPTPTPAPPDLPPVDLGALAIGVELAGSAFDQPLLVTHAGDGSGRAFVLEKTGYISLLDGSLYLDISDRVLWYDLITQEHELGLLGLAFHPDFENNRYFYVHYTDLNQEHVISRFTEGPNGQGDPSSEYVLLRYPQPDVNFVGGMLHFGRDGYLYIGMGTGTSVDPDQVVAQELDNLFGKLLRIDVDGGEPYGIPPDNPFVGVEGARPEIWAYGLRNPWRFAFDRVTNDLYIGGPGEFRKEWVNFVEGGDAAGLNFGWPIIEGDECWEAAVMPCDTTGLEFPILTYPRADGNCVIIGGYPYRGPSYPALQGAYLYGDYCSGRIWAAARDAEGVWNSVELLDTDMLITSFGEDEAGEVYVIDGLSGGVYRIVPG